MDGALDDALAERWHNFVQPRHIPGQAMSSYEALKAWPWIVFAEEEGASCGIQSWRAWSRYSLLEHKCILLHCLKRSESVREVLR